MDRVSFLDGKAVALMALVCAILALQQIAIKAAALDMPPLLQVAVRSGMAALFVGAYLRRKGENLTPSKGKLLPGLAVGILFTLEFLFVAEGLRFTDASHMVAMLYTAPAFAAFGLHFAIPEERLHPVQWGGLALAFSGIAAAMYVPGGSGQAADWATLFGDFLGLLAGLAWGATTVVIRLKLSDIPAVQTTFMQLATCFCILTPLAAMTDQLEFTMTTTVWASLLFQVMLVCVFAFMLWFWLLRHYPASQLGALSFLTPVFGVAFGAGFLGESPAPRFVAGLGLVLAGIAIVSGWRWFEGYLPAYPFRFRGGKERS